MFFCRNIKFNLHDYQFNYFPSVETYKNLDYIAQNFKSIESDVIKIKILGEDKIKEKTRDEWADIFDGTDACVAPVLNLSEAPEHYHMKSRNSFVEIDGIIADDLNRSVIQEQVEIGVAVRMAVLHLLVDRRN